MKKIEQSRIILNLNHSEAAKMVADIARAMANADSSTVAFDMHLVKDVLARDKDGLECIITIGGAPSLGAEVSYALAEVTA